MTNKGTKFAVAVLLCSVALSVMAQDVEVADERAATDRARQIARRDIGVMASRAVGPAEQARSIPRIVNGLLQEENGYWAWTVSVMTSHNGARGLCGGALVHPRIARAVDGTRYVEDWLGGSKEARWVVTAAHCVTAKDGTRLAVEDIVVRGGTIRTDDVHRTGHRVEGVSIHPEYGNSNLTNDVAVLKIGASVNPVHETARMRSIRLPSDFDNFWLYRPYAALTVHGWGRTAEGGPISAGLQRAVLPVVDMATCEDEYSAVGARVQGSMFCAGYSTGGYDSCSGDSGGPISFVPAGSGVVNPVDEPVLAGVVSWGIGCARRNMFGVYTNVLKVRDWIERAVVELSD